MLAMHMDNVLLSPVVAGGLILLSGVGVALASRWAHTTFDPARVPLMGVMGAFVFAAQMINFPILPGTSGHLIGSVLLAILLGPHAATLVITSILIVQCLIFQDGGILALGANILNMGVVPCYLGYAIYRGLMQGSPTPTRFFVAVFAAALAAAVAGAGLVPVQVALSGLLAVPFWKFLGLMVGLHLLTGAVEGLITWVVLGYLARVRPELLSTLPAGANPQAGKVKFGAVVATMLVVALLLGGAVSLVASSSPDALESVASHEVAGDEAAVKPNPSPVIERVGELQERTAPLPDYGRPEMAEWLGTSLSGLIGTAITLLVVWTIGRALRKRSSVSPAVAGPPETS